MVKRLSTICLLLLLTAFAAPARAANNDDWIRVDFFGDTLRFNADTTVRVPFPANQISLGLIKAFHQQMEKGHYQPILDTLLYYKEKNQLNDWFYYQLVRRTAQQLAPKADNYYRYTLYKWFLMVKSGFDADLSICEDELLFSIYSNDEVFGIPFYVRNNRQYVCLNIHDYVHAKADSKPMEWVDLIVPGAVRPFSYKVTQLPEFRNAKYTEKDIQFDYGDRTYSFAIKLNPQIQQVFANYPALDAEAYFNIPMSKETYQSLVPLLRKNVKHMKVQKGVDYLMKFTRYAFLYEPDDVALGKEKHMGPEEMLLYEYSDCDDRAALFFYLVKEIYNLPMIALMYPTHINIGVQFDKPKGETIEYNGRLYSICEPTPQGVDLAVGQVAPQLKGTPYRVVYAYDPKQKVTH